MHRYLLALSCGGLLLLGQQPTGIGSFKPDRGFLPFGSYADSGIENINETTGAVNLSIPIAQLPPGRAGMSWGVNLVYNSELYDTRTGTAFQCAGANSTDCLVTLPTGQTSQQVNIAKPSQYERPGSVCVANQPETQRPYKASLILPDGSSHILRWRQAAVNVTGGDDGYYSFDLTGMRAGPTCGTNFASAMDYATSDGTFIRVTITNDATAGLIWIASFPDGRTVSGPAFSGPGISDATRMCDRNDNCVDVA